MNVWLTCAVQLAAHLWTVSCLWSNNPACLTSLVHRNSHTKLPGSCNLLLLSSPAAILHPLHSARLCLRAGSQAQDSKHLFQPFAVDLKVFVVLNKCSKVILMLLDGIYLNLPQRP